MAATGGGSSDRYDELDGRLRPMVVSSTRSPGPRLSLRGEPVDPVRGWQAEGACSPRGSDAAAHTMAGSPQAAPRGLPLVSRRLARRRGGARLSNTMKSSSTAAPPIADDLPHRVSEQSPPGDPGQPARRRVGRPGHRAALRRRRPEGYTRRAPPARRVERGGLVRPGRDRSRTRASDVPCSTTIGREPAVEVVVPSELPAARRGDGRPRPSDQGAHPRGRRAAAR